MIYIKKVKFNYLNNQILFIVGYCTSFENTDLSILYNLEF